MANGLFGNWGRLKNILTTIATLPQNMLLEKRLREIGEQIDEKIKQNVEGQDIYLAPLAAEYLARKIRQGLDSRILIATHDWLDNIQVLDVVKDGNSLVVTVGSQYSAHESGLSYAALTQYIEYGTERQPERPIFHLTWHEMKDDVRESVMRGVEEVIFKF